MDVFFFRAGYELMRIRFYVVENMRRHIKAQRSIARKQIENEEEMEEEEKVIIAMFTAVRASIHFFDKSATVAGR